MPRRAAAFNFVIPTGAERRDLRFQFWTQRMCRGRIASGFRFSTGANSRSLAYAQDDKIKGMAHLGMGGGWMD